MWQHDKDRRCCTIQREHAYTHHAHIPYIVYIINTLSYNLGTIFQLHGYNHNSRQLEKWICRSKMKLANESTFLVGHPSKSQRDKTGRQGGSGKINVSQSWFHSLKSKNPYGWRYLGQPEKDVMKANISFIFTYIYQVSKVYPRKSRPKIPRSIYLRLSQSPLVRISRSLLQALFRLQEPDSDLYIFFCFQMAPTPHRPQVLFTTPRPKLRSPCWCL